MRLRLCVLLAAVAHSALAQVAPTPSGGYDPANINYGIGAILPKDQPLQPLTGEQRWRLWVNDNFANPLLYARTAGMAAYEQSLDRPEAWGSGISGYGQRFASRYARSFISSSVELGGAALVGYEPRFVRCRCTGFGPRLWHAVTLEVLTYDRNGRRVLHWPRIVGAYGSEVIGATWTPGQKWSAQGIRNANEQIYFGVGWNVLREFGPELKRAFRFGR